MHLNYICIRLARTIVGLHATRMSLGCRPSTTDICRATQTQPCAQMQRSQTWGFDCFVSFGLLHQFIVVRRTEKTKPKKKRKLHKLAYLGTVFSRIYFQALTILQLFCAFLSLPRSLALKIILGASELLQEDSENGVRPVGTTISGNTWDDELLNCINNDFIRKWKRFISLQSLACEFCWFFLSCFAAATQDATDSETNKSNAQRLIWCYKCKCRYSFLLLLSFFLSFSLARCNSMLISVVWPPGPSRKKKNINTYKLYSIVEVDGFSWLFFLSFAQLPTHFFELAKILKPIFIFTQTYF